MRVTTNEEVRSVPSVVLAASPSACLLMKVVLPTPLSPTMTHLNVAADSIICFILAIKIKLVLTIIIESDDLVKNYMR